MSNDVNQEQEKKNDSTLSVDGPVDSDDLFEQLLRQAEHNLASTTGIGDHQITYTI
jgi:hypothetical protein